MKTSALIVIGVLGVLSLALAAGAEQSRQRDDAQFKLPGQPSTSDGILTTDVREPQAARAATSVTSCRIVKASADLDSIPPVLMLEGVFCLDPSVSIGCPGGTLETATVLSSEDAFVDIDVTGNTDPATCLVVVTCPR